MCVCVCVCVIRVGLQSETNIQVWVWLGTWRMQRSENVSEQGSEKRDTVARSIISSLYSCDF